MSLLLCVNTKCEGQGLRYPINLFVNKMLQDFTYSIYRHNNSNASLSVEIRVVLKLSAKIKGLVFLFSTLRKD